MRKMKKTIAGLIVLQMLISGTMLIQNTAEAQTVRIGWRGDMNQDDTLSVKDIVLLQKYLVGTESFDRSILSCNADVLEDGRVNCFDLSLLRQCVTNEAEWIGIYSEIPDEETDFISAPIKAITASLPSQDDASLVIFYVDFPDCQFDSKLSESEVEQIAFGSENIDSEYYPFESMSAFYKRSSKSAMNLNGKVFSYTAKNSISYYNENKVALAEECFEAFKENADFAEYDKNCDGKIDATLFTVPPTANDDYWWPCAGAFGDPEYSVDGVNVGHIITGNVDPVDYSNFNSSYLHEMGHCMGLPDYYLYSSDDFDSMHGPAGYELMDADAYSDFSAFSKLMLGWYRENQVLVYDYSQGEQTFNLKNAQTDDGNCVIIPYGELSDSYSSEYFIIEYSTNGGNNSGIAGRWWENIDSGIRIHHIKGDIHNNGWWTHFKYENGSEFTGGDDAGIRLIRLVNDGGDSFVTGDKVNNSVSGFGWYDSSENESVDPGVEITVGELTDDGYSITISPVK